MEEETDDLENIVAGLLHVEGEGVAAVPDLDEEDTLEEVLDGQEGRTQHLPPRTRNLFKLTITISLNLDLDTIQLVLHLFI